MTTYQRPAKPTCRRIALHGYHLLLLGSIIWLGQTAMVVPFQPVCSAEKGVGTGNAISHRFIRFGQRIKYGPSRNGPFAHDGQQGRKP